MSGLSDDPRKFRKQTSAQRKEPSVTRDIPDDRAEFHKCNVCGLPITGYAWQVADGKYVDFRCRNEG